MTYEDYLASKIVTSPACGLSVPELHPALRPDQRDIVRWALRRGRSAVFADCGLGKTLIELEWAARISQETVANVLILAPLAVAFQHVQEGEKFGIPVRYCRSQSEVQPGVTVANYEMLPHFDPSQFSGVVLDESSILKNYDGKTRNAIIGAFGKTPYRLAATATPAPNDHMELGNHSEFLGVMSRVEMLSMFFVHDGGDTSKWRIKGHAEDKFWKWVASWAVMIRKPSDLGYSDDGFALPPLTTRQITVSSERCGDFLFPMEARTLQERLSARRDSISDRVAAASKLATETDDIFIFAVALNAEADALEEAIPGAVQIRGSDSIDVKQEKLARFSRGEIKRFITKASITGLGLNWQHCHNLALVGLSDSWEDYYQLVRRHWRFGQRAPVNVYLIVSEAEGAVVANIKRKEADALVLADSLIKHMSIQTKEDIQGAISTRDEYESVETKENGWQLHLGDCVEVARKMPDESIDYSVFSPPFASLYTYSASERDMGNCANYEQFFQHFKFLVAALFRVLKPGRNLSFHCMNLPTTKSHHGYIGIQDFRGHLICLFQSAGFIFHSEVCIWKDPVTAMQRTKALGLLWKQIKKDSCMSRQGIPDYLVTMRKPGENPNPVAHSAEEFPVDQWQQWASPVWMDINPSETLQHRSAREERDERHICPLQLEVIRRAIVLWSNRGDLVFSPFTGIGSEGYVAIKEGRKFVGAELKRSYFQQAVGNLRQATLENKEQELALT